MRTGIIPIERRALLLGAGASLIAKSVHAQSSDPVVTDPSLTDIQLTRNLFTRISTDVRINGQGPFNFVIDTGSAATVVADTVASRLQLPALAPLVVHGIATATVTACVGISSLGLRGLTTRNLHCPVLSREQLGADGLIGLDVLGHFRLTFDTERRAASLGQPGMSIMTCGAHALGSRVPRDRVRSRRGRFGQLIMGNLQISGQSAAAFVDSGAQYSIGNHALRQAIEARRAGGLSAPRRVAVFGVTGQSLDADLARVADFRLGYHRLGPVSLLFADLYCFEALNLSDQPALLIGADLLGRFRQVSLDFARNAVAFEGVRPASAHPLEEAVSV